MQHLSSPFAECFTVHTNDQYSEYPVFPWLNLGHKKTQKSMFMTIIGGNSNSFKTCKTDFHYLYWSKKKKTVNEEISAGPVKPLRRFWCKSNCFTNQSRFHSLVCFSKTSDLSLAESPCSYKNAFNHWWAIKSCQHSATTNQNAGKKETFIREESSTLCNGTTCFLIMQREKKPASAHLLRNYVLDTHETRDV